MGNRGLADHDSHGYAAKIVKRCMTTTPVLEPTVVQCGAEMFHADVQFLETRWQRTPIAGIDLPVLDLGAGDPLVFVPILEHLEFVYVRQIRTFSPSRRVILYRRRESRTRFVSLRERVGELYQVLDALHIVSADFVAHGDAAMVLLEFALRYPKRCRSLVIVAQGADSHIRPHPFIWLLHELFLRLPIENLVSASLLRCIVLGYITHCEPSSNAENIPSTIAELPRELIERQFRNMVSWPALYRYSVLPVIHGFDIRAHLATLTMPILLINRWDDALSPEVKTAWLAQKLPRCVYHVVPGRERFFLYSEAKRITPLIQTFLATR